jgi:hypothetical protein
MLLVSREAPCVLESARGSIGRWMLELNHDVSTLGLHGQQDLKK